MSAANHLREADLLAYWSGDLGAAEEVLAEEHLMGCGACTELSERVGLIVHALRTSIAPIVTSADVERLRQKGVRVVENAVRPGGRITAVFRKDVDVLLHSLEGLPLRDVAAVDLELLSESQGGDPFMRLEGVPFSREEGRVLIACQRHFSGTPPDIVFVVHGRRGDAREVLGRFTVLHEYEA